MAHATILVSIFPNPLLKGLHVGLYNLVDMFCVSAKDAHGLEPLPAHVTLKGPLPSVLPLVHNQSILCLEHLLAEAALELGRLVPQFMRAEGRCGRAALPAVPALILLICRVFHGLVLEHLVLGVKGQQADWAGRGRLDPFVL